jgi:S-adenosylmethionine decarboxylase
MERMPNTQNSSRTRARVIPLPRAIDSEPGVGFGPHLTFDGSGCPPRRLDRLESIYDFLHHFPDVIGMTRIMPPYVLRYADRGLAGFVLIAESHVTVHTYPSAGRVMVDVFSCRAFDVERAVAEVRALFTPDRVEWKLLDRGREFPRSIAGSRDVVLRERRAMARAMGLEASR